MKEMEAKTENRYEYRKLQEKRKQMIAPDLFEFAYVPDWYEHLAELERLALPELGNSESRAGKQKIQTHPF